MRQQWLAGLVTLDGLWVVFVVLLLAGMIAVVYLVHRFFVNKHVWEAYRKPYRWITVFTIGLFLAWTALTYVFDVSFYTVLFVGWVTQLIGYLMYRKLNENQGHPIPPLDLRNAFFITAVPMSMVAMILV